jgi:EmrB/QacA subfamily drug resistance transporter
MAGEQGLRNSADELSAVQRAKFRAAFFAVAPSMFLGSLDQTIVAAALPVIARSFGGLALVTWVITGYLLAATVAAPVYGRLGDAFGRRLFLLWSLALFLVGSFVCALAPSLWLLIAGRCLQGFGGGGLMTLSQALIGEVVSAKERGRFQGWFGAVFALASTIGPAAGGVLTEHFGWRSIFWINVPLSLLAVGTALRVTPSPGTGKYSTDVRGIALFVAGTITLLLAMTFGGHQLGWTSLPLVGLIAISILCISSLCRTEHRSKDPLLSPKIVEDSIVWRSSLAVFLYAAVLFGLIVQLPLFLQSQFGISTTASGLLLIPLTAAQVAVSTATGLRISVTGHPKFPMLLGLLSATSGFCILALALHQGIWIVAALTLFIGAGLGSPMPAAQTIVQWAAGTAELGEATAFLSFARSVGGVFGAAVTSTVLTVGRNSSTTGESVPLRFGWMFATLGFLAILGTAITATLPNVDLGKPSMTDEHTEA